MTTTKTVKIPVVQRSRSRAYMKRTAHLLELAEQELISTDGHLTSIEGLRKLKHKVYQFQLA